MKNFFRSFIASDRENNLSEQNLPESIELNEQELESATGGCGDDHHHRRHHRHDCDDYDYCDYDYCN